MTPRFSAKVLCSLLFVTALSIGGEGNNGADVQDVQNEEGYRRVSVADCTFEREPDDYLYRVRRHLEGLVAETEQVTRRRVDYSAGKSSKGTALTTTLPHNNYIDDFIFGRMHADSIPHAPLATDEEFIRRAYLDLTGRIPDVTAFRQFLEDQNPNKRIDLVHTLVNSEGYIDKLTMYYGDLLKNVITDSTSNVNLYVQGRNVFYRTIRAAVEANEPYDSFVRRLIAAEGSSWEKGELNWILKGRQAMGPAQDASDMMFSRAASQFLGLSQVDCVLCHDGKNHLEKLSHWGSKVTRMEAWEMAAFFSRSRIQNGPNQLQPPANLYWYIVTEATTGEYQLNTTAGNRTPRQPVNGSNLVRPRYIFSTSQASGSNYRERLANNLTADRQFARATVNYLWKYLMGMGIVEPADQFDLTRLNPAQVPAGWTIQPSHPELLEALTDDFIRSGFNVRHIVTIIAQSNAYQLSSRFPGEWQPEYATYFARKFVRRLWGEEVHDAITMATGVSANYTVQELPNVQWAMQLPEAAPEPRSNGGVNTFLNLFLRGNRDLNPRLGDATILQALNMMNNTFVTNRIRNATVGSTINKLLANREYDDKRVVEELFLATLSRGPSEAELAFGLAALKASRTTGAENLAWALFNKIDFLYNY